MVYHHLEGLAHHGLEPQQHGEYFAKEVVLVVEKSYNEHQQDLHGCDSLDVASTLSGVWCMPSFQEQKVDDSHGHGSDFRRGWHAYYRRLHLLH